MTHLFKFNKIVFYQEFEIKKERDKPHKSYKPNNLLFNIQGTLNPAKFC